MNNNMALSISNLEVKLNEFKLENITFDIPRGVILGIVGKNGAGKTTLIKAIAGIHKKQTGNILVNNYSLANNEEKYLAQLGIVPDYDWLNPFFTPFRLANQLTKIYPQFDKEYYLNQLEILEIPVKQRIGRLSKGNQKKVGLIVVMSLKPNLLILDEITANIDPISKRDILTILQSYVEDETKTIIYSTHQTDELDKIADYVLCINRGKIKFFNDKESLIEQHRLIKVSEEQYALLDKRQIVSAVKGEFGYNVLIKSSSNDHNYVRPNIEDLIYGYSGGTIK